MTEVFEDWSENEFDLGIKLNHVDVELSQSPIFQSSRSSNVFLQFQGFIDFVWARSLFSSFYWREMEFLWFVLSHWVIDLKDFVWIAWDPMNADSCDFSCSFHKQNELFPFITYITTSYPHCWMNENCLFIKENQDYKQIWCLSLSLSSHSLNLMFIQHPGLSHKYLLSYGEMLSILSSSSESKELEFLVKSLLNLNTKSQNTNIYDGRP